MLPLELLKYKYIILVHARILTYKIIYVPQISTLNCLPVVVVAAAVVVVLIFGIVDFENVAAV